jgi:predicted dehydrogenase
MALGPVRVGFLGSGMIATFSYGYLPGMSLIADKAVVVALCDPLLERARSVAKEYGIPEIYPTLDELLQRSDAELIVNLTPIPLHGETSLQALRAGKHVVTEKPIASTIADADLMIETARSRGLTLVAAPPNALDPNRQEVRRLIQAGAIGKPCFARVRSSHGGPASGAWPNDPTWFYQEGSGPLLDMGVYGIHDITTILGPAKRVVAFSGITEPVRYVRGGPFKGKRIDVTTDDNTLLMLDFGDSTFGVVDGTFNVNAAKSPAIEIFGREGTLNVPDDMFGGRDQPPFDLFRLDTVGGVDGWVTSRNHAVAAAARRFDALQRTAIIEHAVDCIRENRQPILSGEQARHALEIMLKAIQSARQGWALDLTTTF